MIGLKRNEIIKKIELYTFMIGVNITFLPHHILGIENMPRRYKDYPYMYKYWQEISTIGSIISLISAIIYFYLLYLQFKNKIKENFDYDLSFFTSTTLYGRTLDVLLPIPSPYHLYPNTPLIL